MTFKIPATAFAGAMLIAMSAVVGAETPLVDAAKRGDTETVRRLLAGGANANQPYGDGTTALHWAAYRNSLELTTILIGAGANVNAATDLGVTPLWLASTEADGPLVQRLLEAGADPNASLPSGETPLMGASRVGRAGAVAALLAKGAQVNAREQSRGQTALMWAASQGHAAIIGLLTQAGADVGARTTNFPTLVNVKPQGFTNSGARAGLSVQAFEDRRGARANTGSARTQRAAGGGGVDDADASGVVSVEYGGYTPLLFAARQGGVDAARALIAARANVNDTASDGTSALVVAAHSGHGALAAMLLEHDADPNAAGAGYTALHMAILRKDVPLVKALLAHGADPRQPLLKGTPARRNATDFMLGGPLIGTQPAYIAARFDEPEIMRLIVRGGGDITAVAPDGSTAIMAAMAGAWLGEGMGIPRGPVETEQRALAAITAAVDLGAAVNAVNAAGDTALHLAVSRNYESIVRFLVGKGANQAIPNKRGQTPRALAEALKRDALVKVLAGI
jgi:ankyrin repeat protein